MMVPEGLYTYTILVSDVGIPIIKFNLVARLSLIV